jgi:hypothetical protein
MTDDPKTKAEDRYWWAPWAVLAGLVLFGLLGYLGVLSPKPSGPTAADVPSSAPTPDRRLAAPPPPSQ